MKARLLMLLLAILMLAACNGNGDDNIEQSANTNTTGDAAPQPAGQDEPPARPDGLPTAVVENVIDGDTIEISGGRTVRLIGINTPEEGEYLYEEASEFTRDLLEGEEVGLEVGAEPRDQFDRELFYVWIGDKLANYEIVRAGYANSYAVPPNVQYRVYFERAADASAANERGIWRRGVAEVVIDLVAGDPPGPDEENMNGEFVRILNTGVEPINLAGFSIRDEGSNVYTFGDFTLEAKRAVTLYSGCGVITQTNVYWCSDTPIWNNTGDTVYLTDAEGLYLDHYPVGRQ